MAERVTHCRRCGFPITITASVRVRLAKAKKGIYCSRHCYTKPRPENLNTN